MLPFKHSTWIFIRNAKLFHDYYSIGSVKGSEAIIAGKSEPFS